MRFLHIHWDRQWTTVGTNRYYQCRCGARRTVRATYSQFSPTSAGWPLLIDQHGQPVNDSGWQLAEGRKRVLGRPRGQS